MAETYSLEFSNLYVTKPPAKTQHNSVALRGMPFSYTQVLAGTAADTCVIARLPPLAMLDLVASWMKGSGFTSGMTLSLGWKAYTDVDGVVQALSATGLYNALDVSNTVFAVTGAANISATPDDALTEMAAVGYKEFRNQSTVDLYLTFGAQVPGAAATIHGILYYLNVG